MKFILGQKIGMSQMFDKNGKLTPVTLIVAGPCYILQKKNKEPASAEASARQGKDGYDAIQIGMEKREKKNKISR